MADRADIEVTGLNTKLVSFAATLTPGESRIFGSLMQAAHDTVKGDVGGYDADGPAFATKISWDSLGVLTTNVAGPGDRIVDTHN